MSTRQLSPARNATSLAPLFPPGRNALLQRKCACGSRASGADECTECVQKKQQHDTRHAGPGAWDNSSGSPIVHEVLRSPGQPLDSTTLAFMEPRFGRDFSNVRVHTGTQATESAQGIDALAFTAGRDIVFGEGQYSPRTVPGQRLLAHELAHVVQQSGGREARSINAPSDQKFEREADRAADRALAGLPVFPLAVPSAPALQRQASGTPPVQSTPPSVRRDRQPIPNPGRDGNRFDATLDREQSLLTITMRVAFDFRTVPGSLNEPWTPERMSRWKSDFIRLTVARWSDRHLLVPDGACPTEGMREVRVLIAVQEDTANPHFRATVDNQDMPAQSGVSRMERRGHFNAPDVKEAFLPDTGTRQTPVEHEFGHMLGVHHIRCQGNEPNCYGVSPTATREEREDVMGVGSEVSKRDYEVFTEVLQQATTCRWKVQERSSLTGILIGLGLVAVAGIGLGIAAALGAFSH